MREAPRCVVQDLAQKSEAEREDLLRKAGAAEETFADVHKMLLALPHVHLSNVRAFVEEEDDVKEMDVLTVEVRARLDSQCATIPAGLSYLIPEN